MRHALAKALWSNQASDQLCINPKDIIQPLMMARLDKGADVSHPMDWNGKVLPLTNQETGDIYHCTVSIEEVCTCKDFSCYRPPTDFHY